MGRENREGRGEIMTRLQEHAEKIRETENLIRATNSAQRKYELHRHLAKLQKEYRIAKRYMREAKHDKGINTAGTSRGSSRKG